MPASIFPSGFRSPTAECSVEPMIRRVLEGQAGLQVDRLVVRQTPAGVCLDGVVRFNDAAIDIVQLIRAATGVSDVLNRLVVCKDDGSAVVSSSDLSIGEYSGHG